jgi:hypothetical protein
MQSLPSHAHPSSRHPHTLTHPRRPCVGRRPTYPAAVCRGRLWMTAPLPSCTLDETGIDTRLRARLTLTRDVSRPAAGAAAVAVAVGQGRIRASERPWGEGGDECELGACARLSQRGAAGAPVPAKLKTRPRPTPPLRGYTRRARGMDASPARETDAAASPRVSWAAARPPRHRRRGCGPQWAAPRRGRLVGGGTSAAGPCALQLHCRRARGWVRRRALLLPRRRW